MRLQVHVDGPDARHIHQRARDPVRAPLAGHAADGEGHHAFGYALIAEKSLFRALLAFFFRFSRRRVGRDPGEGRRDARVGVLRHSLRIHDGDVEPARLDDVPERVCVDGAGVVRHGGGLRFQGHGDRAHARRPLERGRHRRRAGPAHHAVDGEAGTRRGHRARRVCLTRKDSTRHARGDLRRLVVVSQISRPLAGACGRHTRRKRPFSSLYPSRRVASSPPPDHFSRRTAAPCRLPQPPSSRPPEVPPLARSVYSARRTRPVGPVGLAAANRLWRPSGGARSARAKRVPARSRDTCATRWRWR